MKTHDLIVTYKNTGKHDFPLILLIGREPNDESVFSNTTGTYDFDNAPKCAFWNQSYGVVGKITGCEGKHIKALSRERAASPIAFTDASPLPIGNHNPKKHEIKKSITESEIDTHVENILAKENILDRVALVILTGHHTKSLPKDAKRVFKYSTETLADRLDDIGIPHISVPFMYGTNQLNILDDFRQSKISTDVVIQVVSEFRALATDNVIKAA